MGMRVYFLIIFFMLLIDFTLFYLLFLSHGFSPDSMIMGTMIAIPKNRKPLLCNSSTYKTIALSSILNLKQNHRLGHSY